jgi:small redox-active disulfide protein 2
MIAVKVLGPGCPNCTRLAESVTRAAASLGVEASVEKVTGLGAIVQYRILAAPGLVVDGQLVCSGRVPTEAEIAGWLANAAGRA